ncbi:MAG: hypothetical protein HKO64_06375 [Xanthomonadales bacterium]|nr:hypothetical protein [Gammaproteobacteria bacterium]NNE05853.1 hypothetical protein [Xanthomonadales bacterium]NNL95231.1 hypothetical protein [Xanthomonadales bacterium]
MQNPRILLIIIAALFTAPLLLAVLMRSSWWDFRPSELSNRGSLVQPPVALNTATLVTAPSRTGVVETRNWQVLFLVGEACTSPCLQALTGVRQVHLASGKHQDEVGLWVVTRQAPSASTLNSIREVYPEFRVMHDASTSLSAALSTIAQQAHNKDALQWDGQALVLDAAAHIILRYGPGFDPGDLAEDLDRLLTWSKQN